MRMFCQLTLLICWLFETRSAAFWTSDFLLHLGLEDETGASQFRVDHLNNRRIICVSLTRTYSKCLLNWWRTVWFMSLLLYCKCFLMLAVCFSCVWNGMKHTEVYFFYGMLLRSTLNSFVVNLCPNNLVEQLTLPVPCSGRWRHSPYSLWHPKGWKDRCVSSCLSQWWHWWIRFGFGWRVGVATDVTLLPRLEKVWERLRVYSRWNDMKNWREFVDVQWGCLEGRIRLEQVISNTRLQHDMFMSCSFHWFSEMPLAIYSTHNDMINVYNIPHLPWVHAAPFQSPLHQWSFCVLAPPIWRLEFAACRFKPELNGLYQRHCGRKDLLGHLRPIYQMLVLSCCNIFVCYFSLCKTSQNVVTF